MGCVCGHSEYVNIPHAVGTGATRGPGVTHMSDISKVDVFIKVRGQVLLLWTHEEERRTGSSEQRDQPGASPQLWSQCPHQLPGTLPLALLVPTPPLENGQTDPCHLSNGDDISPQQRDGGASERNSFGRESSKLLSGSEMRLTPQSIAWFTK